MEINFSGDTLEVTEGLKLLGDKLSLQLTTEGYPIKVIKRVGNLKVTKHTSYGEIYYQEKTHFFRGVGLFLENIKTQEEFAIEEIVQFDTGGAMLDSSRNAVIAVDTIKELLRDMSVMGLNLLMMYTEDTYEVDEYPYFGYMRGRYTKNEIRELDQYAIKLGIEMVPCIQTLGHLREALKWEYANELRDTEDILLIDEPKTYAFLKNLIKSATEPYTSKRIHIGMDEAHDLGLGRYLELNGYKNRFELMNSHLQQVVKITESFGLKAMLWSDMYFKLGSKTNEYTDINAEFPEKIISEIPDVQMVYWDYYHTDENIYTGMMKKHSELGRNQIFAGGIWTWNGLAPNYGKTWATTTAGLMAAKKNGVKEVFATMWGDNGAETPILTALPGLQLYAEHMYHKIVDEASLAKRFNFCTGFNIEDFLLLQKLDETTGVSSGNIMTSQTSKILLWQDILMGLFDENIKGLDLNQYYSDLVPILEKIKKNNLSLEFLFDFYKNLAQVLSIKSEVGVQLKIAYDASDRLKMQEIIKDLHLLSEKIDFLRKSHRTLWFSINKPFGWEILDIRYGGLLTRNETTIFRLTQWINHDIELIEELREKRLPFKGPYGNPEGSLGNSMYHRIVTSSAFSS